MAGDREIKYLQQCRLCRDTEGELSGIFGEDGLRRSIAEKINVCLPLTVKKEDLLPKMICSSCIRNVEQLHTFRKMCLESALTMESSLHGNLLEPECCVNEVEMQPDLDTFLKCGEDDASISITAGDISSGNQQLANDVVEEASVKMNYLSAVPDVRERVSMMEIAQPGPEDYVLMKEESFVLNADDDGHRTTAIEFQRSSIHESDKDILLIQKKRRVILPQMWDVYEKTVEGQDVVAVTHRRYVVSKSAFRCSLCGNCILKETGEDVKLGHSVNKCEENCNEGSYPCHVCGKVFPHCDPLKRHLQVHYKYKLFACTICGRTFSRKEHLTRHTISHTDDRPYHCEICNKDFTRKEHLTRHRLSHPLFLKHEYEAKLPMDDVGPPPIMDSVRPFSCELCGHGFSRKDHLSQHQKRMHPLFLRNGEVSDETKPYTCCICKKKFTRKEHLVRHQGIHVREFFLAGSETVTREDLSFPIVSPN